MNEQERKIVKLLLNEMAFEGARSHFDELPPDIPNELFREVERLGIPERWNGKTESYIYATIRFDPGKTVYENCFDCLRTVRNNIIHANKAYRPDTPARLTDILDWAEAFIDAVYETESPLAKRASEIKQIMRIDSF